MATIFETAKYSDCQRPVYTSLELSNMVKKKRMREGLSHEDFAIMYNVEEVVLQQIEEGKQSFGPQLYKACGRILELSIDEITKVEQDDIGCAGFRVSADSQHTRHTIDLANYLFNEIIMQKRISVS